MLTNPTVMAAINPTINGLYPIDFNSLKLIDIPTAAIAIVRKTVAKFFIIEINKNQSSFSKNK